MLAAAALARRREELFPPQTGGRISPPQLVKIIFFAPRSPQGSASRMPIGKVVGRQGQQDSLPPPLPGRRELSSTAAGRQGRGGRSGRAAGSPRQLPAEPCGGTPARSPAPPAFARIQRAGRRAERPVRPPGSRQRRERGLRVGSGPCPAPPVLLPAGGGGSIPPAGGSGAAGRGVRG